MKGITPIHLFPALRPQRPLFPEQPPLFPALFLTWAANSWPMFYFQRQQKIMPHSVITWFKKTTAKYSFYSSVRPTDTAKTGQITKNKPLSEPKRAACIPVLRPALSVRTWLMPMFSDKDCWTWPPRSKAPAISMPTASALRIFSVISIFIQLTYKNMTVSGAIISAK